MKHRINSLDLRVLAYELQSIGSLHLQNIYDLADSRCFIFKFNKYQLLVDPGFRIHLTQFNRQKLPSPSPFVAKLRKHIRSRRLTRLQQIGTDRALKLSFAHQDPLQCYDLVFEFYAKGNIILICNGIIVALFRNVTVLGEQKYAVGEKYILDQKLPFEPMSCPRLLNLLATSGNVLPDDRDNPLQSKKTSKNTLLNVLTVQASEYGAALIEHIIQSSGLDPNTPLASINWTESSPQISALLNSFAQAQQIVDACTQSSVTGYIIAQKETDSYEEFHPFLPIQCKNNPQLSVLSFEGFSHTTDIFFSTIEAKKLELRLRQAHIIAEKRLQTAQLEHSQRLHSLELVQQVNIKKARAIEANLNTVDETTAAVSGLIAQGIDWRDIETLIKLEKANNNPVAQIICLPLNLSQNTITLSLAPSKDDHESGTESDNHIDSELPAVFKVDIDLSISAWANARNYYGKKRQAAAKQEKTLQSSSKALKSTEKKIAADLSKSLAQEKPLMHPIRKTQWFEKFYWFISSENYLVLGGRDAQQNELLYKRYLRRGDIYVHADLQGASSVIIKNTSQTAPIPPGTLSQAGLFSVATSKAWDAKILTSAWWVHHDQVSKTAPTGEYITTGSFIIRGKKNFLAPAPLVMGFGILWVLDEESRERHLKRRLERQQLNAESEPISEVVKETQNPEMDDEASKDKYSLADYGEEIPLPSFLLPVQREAKNEHVTPKKHSKPKTLPLKSELERESQPVPGETPSKKVNVRGKKGQRKKAQKYAHQDDEERQLRMQLLGVAKQDKPPPEPPAIKRKPKVEHQVKQVLREENVEVLDEEEETNFTLLDNFTPSPVPDDVLVGVIPVCGPYAAMGKYKYKVKLVPGSMKKGKAVKTILSQFLSMKVGHDNESATLPELELIKTIKGRGHHFILLILDAEICVGISKMNVMAGKLDVKKNKSKGKGTK